MSNNFFLSIKFHSNVFATKKIKKSVFLNGTNKNTISIS